MNYKRMVIVFLYLFYLSNNAYAQSAESGAASSAGSPVSSPDMIPPSPEAFNFTKYGNVPVGLFTGTAQYSIPIYDITCGKLGHGITLNYASNGVRVDEIPSRVGLGWSLAAGGSITRIVRGLPDDFTNRVFNHVKPANTDSFYTFVRQASYATVPDFQPDEYSFNVNGMSGKFIRAEDGSFKVLSASKIQIQQDSYSKIFTFTGTDGSKYYFNDIEYTKTYNTVAPEFPENIPGFTATAWYISKIISATNDSLVFNYTALADTIKYYNGISQDYSTYNPSSGVIRIMQTNENAVGYSGETQYLACLDPECLFLNTTLQITQSFSKYLSSIVFNNGKVEFVTSLRDDVIGERKVDTIKIKNSSNTLIKCFALIYTYSISNSTSFLPTSSHAELKKRLYLTEFHEVSKDLSTSKNYIFAYDDMNSLPPRLTFCQDKFGFFNGKINQYFFANDTWMDYWLGNNHFGGDRSFNFSYAKKGVLTNIQYPTGGSTTIEYEPHKVKDYSVNQVHDDSLVANIDTSTIMNQMIYSDTFSTMYGRDLKIIVKCDWATSPAPYFPENYYAYFDILDAATNQCVGSCQKHVLPGSSYINNSANASLSGSGVYKLRIYASQARLRIKATIHKIYYTIDSSQNVGIGGIRVKSLTDYREGRNQGSKREFIYADWDNPSTSSGSGIYIYPDNRNFVSFHRTFAIRTPSGVLYDLHGVPMRGWYAANNVLHSNSVRNLYLNENGSVTYSKVIELNTAASGINNGGKEYNFLNQRKTPAKTITDALPGYVFDFSPFLQDGYPMDNDDFLNGITQSEKTFTYTTKFGARKIITEKFNYYSNQQLGKDSFYLVQQVRKRDSYDITLRYFSDYDINKYFRYYGWVKLDSSIEKTYDTTRTLITKNSYLYSPKNYQVNEIDNSKSTGDTKAVRSTFPADIISSDATFPVYNGMALKNILTPVIDQKNILNNSIELNRNKTNYNLLTVNGKSFYAPISKQSSLRAGTLDNDVTIDQYDEKGNILQFTSRDGIINAIIWGYGKTYPVAKISGVTYNNAISLSGINLTVVDNPVNDNTLRVELNKLRNLSGSMVTSYTYAPLIGITSITDANSKLIFYEYDLFNRLARIRDIDSNILKQYDYAYAPVSVCNGTTCTGQGYKCLNNFCVQGTRVNTSSVRISPTQWNCTYHYEWDDGTSSINYTSTEANNCMAILIPL